MVAALALLLTFDFVHVIAGNGQDQIRSVAYGPDGSLYLAGTTNSTDLGAGQKEAQAFLRRLSPDGKQVLFTKLLPDIRESPVALAVDGNGDSYVAGSLQRNRPTDPSIVTLEQNGGIVLLKVSGGGDRFIYKALLIPQVFYNPPVALAVDSTGTAYVGTAEGYIDVRKVDPTGRSLAYKYKLECQSAYRNPEVNALALGPDRSLYIAGTTSCRDFPATPNAMRSSTVNPQNGDGYVIRLNPAGTAPIYATLVGGDSTDQVLGLAVDTNGKAVVAGSTVLSAGLTGLAADPIGFTPDATASYGFLMGLDPAGARAEYSFLLPVLELRGIAVDSEGFPYVGGFSSYGAVLAKVNPLEKKFAYLVNAPAASARIASVALAGKRLAFGGWMGSLDFPDAGGLNAHGVNGFSGVVSAQPATTDLALTAFATSYRPEVYKSTQSCRFRIENRGPAAASRVVLIAGGTNPFFKRWEANVPGFVVPSLFTLTAQPARAYLERLDAGSAAEIEFSGPGTCTGSIGSATAEIYLENNVSAATYEDRPTVAFYVESNIPYFHYRRDDWPVEFTEGMGLPPRVPAGGTVRISIPSPQVADFIGPVTFVRWGDGSTENPRTFQAGDGTTTVSALLMMVSAPQFQADGLVNGASFRTGPVSPGEIVTVFGLNLGPQNLLYAAVGDDGRFVRELNGLKVTFDGVAAPLIYSRWNQAAFIVPYSVAGKSSVKVRIESANGAGESDIPVAATSPALFTAASNGYGQAAAHNQNLTYNGADAPAAPGEIVTLWATGEGVLNPGQEDGKLAASEPLARPVAPVSVTIDGRDAEVLYSGVSPGMTAGLLQVNVRVPRDVAPGHHVPVVLKIGDAASPAGVTIAVRGAEQLPAAQGPQLAPNGLPSLTPEPAAITADSGEAQIVVQGFGFQASWQVLWNGKPRPTEFLDPYRLRVRLGANDTAVPSLSVLTVTDGARIVRSPAPVWVYARVWNTDFVYDPGRRRFWVAVPKADKKNGPSIALLNPESGRVDRYIPMPADASRLALSPDGSVLYAGTAGRIYRLRTDTFAFDLNFEVPPIETGGLPAQAYAMAVPDGQPDVLVAVLARSPSSGGAVVVFDRGVPRPKKVVDGPRTLPGWAGARLIGRTGNAVSLLDITTEGVSVARRFELELRYNCALDAGRLYCGSGAVVDPLAGSYTGSYAGKGTTAVLPASDRIAFIDSGQQVYAGGPILSPLTVLERSTGSAVLGTLVPLAAADQGRTLLPWGENGLALRDAEYERPDLPADRIYLFRVP